MQDIKSRKFASFIIWKSYIIEILVFKNILKDFKTIFKD